MTWYTWSGRVLAPTVLDRILKFCLLSCIPQLGHLITCLSFDLYTADYEGGPLTNVNIGSDYCAGFQFQSPKM